MLGRNAMENLHLRSESTPADDPSRLLPVRKPKPRQPWMLPLLEPEGDQRDLGTRLTRLPRFLVECVAGAGGLTTAFELAGWRAHEPMEAFPEGSSKNKYVAQRDLSKLDV